MESETKEEDEDYNILMNDNKEREEFLRKAIQQLPLLKNQVKDNHDAKNVVLACKNFCSSIWDKPKHMIYCIKDCSYHLDEIIFDLENTQI